MRWIPVLFVVSFAGCSGNTSTEQVEVKQGSAVGAGRDSCSFLTLADVQEVYGPDMKKSETNRSFSGPSNDLSTCTYEGGEPLRVVTMMATWSKTENSMSSRDAYAASAEKDIPAELREALAVEKVDFQGLPALWQAGQLRVFKEGVMLSILADPAPGKDAKQTMEVLMSNAIGRL
jgi:hypothetical protein